MAGRSATAAALRESLDSSSGASETTCRATLEAVRHPSLKPHLTSSQVIDPASQGSSAI